MKYLVHVITLLIILLNLTSCAAMEQIDKAMTQRAKDQMERWREEAITKGRWENKYAIDVLYRNMPESEFINLFTKTSSWVDPERPYITKSIRKGRKTFYILSGLESSYDYRVTFEKGRLIKFEYHGHGGGGNLFGYNDATFLLKNKAQGTVLDEITP